MPFQLTDLFPFLSWVRRYRRPHFRADLFAGLTVAVVALPQSMAYALIAGLPVQYGLYASIVPTLIACLWGSSAHLINRPHHGRIPGGLQFPGQSGPQRTPAYIELAFGLAGFAGLIQIVMGAARLGNLLDFVSRSVLLGFTAGAAVLIAFKQLPGLFGLTVPQGGHFIVTLGHLLGHLHQSHLITLALGVLTMAVILAVKKFGPPGPGP